MKTLGTITLTFAFSIMVALVLSRTNYYYVVERLVDNSYFYTFIVGIGITLFASWVINKATS